MLTSPRAGGITWLLLAVCCLLAATSAQAQQLSPRIALIIGNALN